MKRSKIYCAGAGLILAGAAALGAGMFVLGGRPGFYIDITGIHLDGAEGDGFTLKRARWMHLPPQKSRWITVIFVSFHRMSLQSRAGWPAEGASRRSR